ncbi:pollen-specific leucine-rich repeat extensin-like protein 2 [Arachis stenosperma]|uniref:pollen-specific leucine-rich repeat extensin-like protein 2 n=1 Tax=Arachis stenosperma TaxID=217475 RepID=UPI0025AC8ADD|nr:pollen-specific leucine-rich repeat extensin-like protein 2 [Arachis stenosperma]
MRSYEHLLRLTAYVPHHPQPPAPQPPPPQPPQHAVFQSFPYYIPQPPPPQPPQHAVFEPFPYYIPKPPAYNHGSHDTQSSHHSQQSQHTHHSQQSKHSHHSQYHDPILTIPSDFSGIPSPSVPADPRRASVDMGHGLRGRTTDHTSESASCDSGYIQRQRAYTVVDTFNPGPSAPTDAGGSAAPTVAGGSAAPTEAGGSGAPGVDDSVRGHPYDLRTERNPPDRYTPSRVETGIMRKGLHWFVGKK